MQNHYEFEVTTLQRHQELINESNRRRGLPQPESERREGGFLRNLLAGLFRHEPLAHQR